MSSSNPYEYDPSLDDDLFSSDDSTKSARRHSFDGTICPACDRVHDLGDMPGHIRESLSRVISEVPGTLGTELLLELEENDPSRTATSLLAAFMRYTTALGNTARPAPALRAVITVLDEMTDGEATRRMQLFEFERQLIGAHLALKSVNNVITEGKAHLDRCESNNDDHAKVRRLITILSFACDMMVDRIQTINERYISYCDSIKVEPREDLMSSGMYEDLSSCDQMGLKTLNSLIAASKIEDQDLNDDE